MECLWVFPLYVPLVSYGFYISSIGNPYQWNTMDIYIYKPTTIGLMTIPEMETMGVDRPTCLSQGTDRLSSTLDGFECPLVHPRPAKKEHPKASQIYHV